MYIFIVIVINIIMYTFYNNFISRLLDFPQKRNIVGLTKRKLYFIQYMSCIFFLHAIHCQFEYKKLIIS